MKIVSKEDILTDIAFYIKEIKAGKVFVYPTDTIYGIGCDATNSNSVLDIQNAKRRDTKPFSVAVPSVNWIERNLIVKDHSREHLAKLPGAYTLVLEIKEPNCISEYVCTGSVGIRIFDNWFYEIIQSSNIPFVSTSVNLAGEKPVNKISEIPSELLEYVDYVIECGEINGKPSTVIDLRGDEPRILRH